MRLTVLGASGTHPRPSEPASGYLLQTKSTTLILDMGSGTLAPLLQRVDPGHIDGVVVTHRHPDHCSDVFGLYHVLRFGVSGGTRPVLAAPEDTLQRLAGFVGAESGHPWFSTWEVVPADREASIRVGDILVTFADADHSVPAVMVRCTHGGTSMTYTGDTGPGAPVAGFAQGTALLLAEAGTSGDAPWRFHLTPAQAGAAAQRAGAARLLVTHLGPTLDPEKAGIEAAAEFDGPVELARAGLEVAL